MGQAVSDQLPEGFELDASELPPGFVVDEKPAPQRTNVLAAALAGLAPAETAMNLGSSALATPIAGLAGIGARALESMGLARQNAGGDVTESVQNALTYQPRTQSGQQMLSEATYPLRKLATAADRAGDPIANPGDPNRPLQMRIPGRGPVTAKEYGDTGSPLIATGINTAIQALPAVFLKGRAKAGAVAEDVTGARNLGRPAGAGEGAQAPAAASQAGRPAGLAPTRAQLSDAADAAYKRADESGVVVTPESFGALKKKIVGEMEGIDPTLHPDATAALKRITQSEGPQSLKQLETLRRIANDAEGSIKPADQRLAGKMVDELDDYIDSLTEKDVVAGDATKGKALAEARNFYSRKKKAEELDRLVSRAELSAPNFSASGMENALRTEFRTLAKNDRRMRRFTAEEQEAIRKVAKGGSTENALRMLGKLAPTGVVSSLPTIIATMSAGPIGIAPALAGLGGRYAATRMTMGNVAKANELVRRGPPGSPPIPPATLQEAVRNGVLTPEQAQFLNQ